MTPDLTADADFSAVVCAYTEERWSDLGRALRSLRAQTRPPAEILLVVDHNPALLERARAAFPWVRVLENRGERGLSGGKNTGAQAARGRVVVFLDDDAWAAPDFLWYLERYHRRPDVLGVGGFVEAGWEAEKPGWWPDEFLWVVGCSYRGQPTRAAAVRNVFGGCMSIRRSVLARIGGFDSGLGRVGRLPAGGEETELCIRAARAFPGEVFLYEPRAWAGHRVPPERATWRYFCSRCFHEGRSKARVAARVGAERGLAAERAYTTRTLPQGVARGLWEGLSGRDPDGPRRSGAIVAGLLLAAVGYARGRLEVRRAARATRTEARP